MDSPTALDLLTTLDSKIDVICKRIDSHEIKNEARYQNVCKKVDDLSEKIHSVELSAAIQDGNMKEKVAEKHGALMAKVAALGAITTIVMTLILNGLKKVFAGN